MIRFKRDFSSSILMCLILTTFNLLILFRIDILLVQQLLFMSIVTVYFINFGMLCYKINGFVFISILLLVFSIVFSLIANIESYISFFALLNFIFFSYFLSVYAKYKPHIFIESIIKYCFLNTLLLLFLLLQSGFNFSSRSLVEGVQPNYIGLIALTCSLSSILLNNYYIKFILLSFLLFVSFVVSSRTAMLCIIIIYLFFIICKLRDDLKKLIFFSFIIFSLVLYFYSDILVFLSNIFMLNDDYRGAGTGFSGRSDRWQVAFEYIEAKPILGYGFKTGESLLGFTTDNGYISLLLELGLVGLISYLFMLILANFFSIINLAKENSAINQFCFISISIFAIYMFFEQRYINFGNSLSFIVFFSIFYVFSLIEIQTRLNKKRG